MKKIKLTQGKYALVDDADYEALNTFKWYAHKNGQVYYAVRNIARDGGGWNTVFMHRTILNPPASLQIDHINGDGLDNRRSNLRPCTHAENARNSRTSTRNTSGYKGVSFYKRYGKWQARIRVDGKLTFLGYYRTTQQAFFAYKKAARELNGEFARFD